MRLIAIIIFLKTYCEVWARILNVALISFLDLIDTNSITKQKFFKKFNSLIKIEQNFSLIQANKVFKILEKNKIYREKTNGFCYYILTAALMNDYTDFLKWCYSNNLNLLKFKNTTKNIDSFVNLILKTIS